MKNYHKRLHNGWKIACGGNDKEEFSQLMKSWKLKFHHGWNINEKSFQKNENFIQIKLMNDNSHNGWKAREKKQKNEKIRWHIHLTSKVLRPFKFPR
jgi:hypothetical protein